MEHIYTTGRGGEYTTGTIPIRLIHVGDGNEVGRGNGADDSDDYIVSSSYLLYWVQTTKVMKEEIPKHRVVCVKSNIGPEGPGECNIHHTNTTKALW